MSEDKWNFLLIDLRPLVVLHQGSDASVKLYSADVEI